MSVPGDSSSSQGGGTAAASPDAVLLELKRLAERRASLKMFYAAADLFRDYKGPFANETAAERVRLADDYDQRGRAAEKQRLERGPIPLPVKPVSQTAPPTPARELPADRPLTSAPRPAPPRVAVPSTAPQKPVPAGAQKAPDDGPKLTMICRWCKEKVSLEVARAGKLVPCPKCGVLIRAPKS